jgi:hypothetical protein
MGLAHIGMSARWRSTVRRLIGQFCAHEGWLHGVPVAAPNGGSARGYLADLSLISVSAVMGIQGRIASVACIFIQSIASYECGHMPR